MTSYQAFLAAKGAAAPPSGMAEPPPISDQLFPFQRDPVRWGLRRGKAAFFEDTGLGKTIQQLEWARIVRDHTGRDVLILAPLAVAKQTVRKAQEWGYEDVHYAATLRDAKLGIVCTNYDRLEHFVDTAPELGGIALDESSILKSLDGATRTQLIDSFQCVPFRSAWTATPSPNDFTELGGHAEFLGICSRAEMLATYFVHDGGSVQDWRLKGHAERDFWRWVCSWGALIKKPSALGYSDEGYDLPPLNVHEHVIRATSEQARAQGLLFAEAAKTLVDQRAARRGSLTDRVAECARIVAAEPSEAWVVWCELNAEADALTKAISGAVQIAGSDSAETKEARLTAFSEGKIRVLVTKPSIAGFGMNWQHAARMIFCGVSHSFEQWYQAVRRQYRFGQLRPVDVHVVIHESEGEVVKNLRRKEADANRMAEEMSQYTREFVLESVLGSRREQAEYRPAKRMVLPTWLAA